MKCPSFLEHAERKQALDKCMAGQEAAVTSFGYIGGYYGACTEEGMMRALQDGPITVALEPAMDFMYYKSGVYSSVKDKKTLPSVSRVVQGRPCRSRRRVWHRQDRRGT
jgi:hypothetical protein